MAAEDGLFNVRTTEDSLMWLWRAHNKVNNRIAGDVTEDPLHPKRQFPDRKLCAECFKAGQYDTNEVLEFLLQFYAVENFRGQGLDPVPVANLPSTAGHNSRDTTGEAARESTSTASARTPLSSHQQASISTSSRDQFVTQQRVSPSPSHTPSFASDQLGSSSVLSQYPYRAPHLVRSSLPPPAVLPPQPGRPEVVPGIMRYPSEMAHVFPAVVRASTPEEDDVRPGLDAGLSRTQRRVVYTRPRVVYSRPQTVVANHQVVTTKPRVVYTRPRVVYTRPRVVYSQPRVVYSQPRVVSPMYTQHRVVRPVQEVPGSSELLRHRGVMPAGSSQSSSHSVQTYWMRGAH